jgi:hypothetical protein
MAHHNWKRLDLFGKHALAEPSRADRRLDPGMRGQRTVKGAAPSEQRPPRQVAESGDRLLSRAEAMLREAEERQRDAEAALRRARRMAAVGWMAAETCRDMTALHAVAARALATSRERLQGDHRAINEIDWALSGLKQAEQMLDRVTAYLDARRENAHAAHIDGLLSGT